MTTAPAPARHSTSRVVLRRSHLACTGAFLIGALPVIDEWYPLPRLGITPFLAIAIALGLSGLKVPVTGHARSVLRRYRRLAVPFAAWVLLSSAVSGSFGSLYAAASFGLWLVLLIPGLARLLQVESTRRWLVNGIAFGALIILVVSTSRLLSGSPVLDRVAGDALGGSILGVNRNLANIVVLTAVSLTAFNRALPRWYRLVFLVMAVAWILGSEGRSGLVGLIALPIVWGLLSSGRGPRVIRALQASLGVLLVAILLSQFGGMEIAAVGRLTTVSATDLDSSDEARVLLIDKAVGLARDHPLFGVGFGRFIEEDHEALDSASSAVVRMTASTANAHNTYLELAATSGIVGGLLFVGFAVNLLRIALASRARDPVSQVAVVTWALLLVVIALLSAGGAALYLPASLALNAALREPAAPTTSEARPRVVTAPARRRRSR